MGLGLTQLEEALLFQAELMDLKASPTRPADGVVVEAKVCACLSAKHCIWCSERQIGAQELRCIC